MQYVSWIASDAKSLPRLLHWEVLCNTRDRNVRKRPIFIYSKIHVFEVIKFLKSLKRSTWNNLFLLQVLISFRKKDLLMVPQCRVQDNSRWWDGVRCGTKAWECITTVSHILHENFWCGEYHTHSDHEENELIPDESNVVWICSVY